MSSMNRTIDQAIKREKIIAAHQRTYRFIAHNGTSVVDTREFQRVNHREAIERAYELTSCAVILDDATYCQLVVIVDKEAKHVWDINLDSVDFR